MSIISDHLGKFRLENIADQSVRIFAWRADYTPSDQRAEYDVNREDLRIVLPPIGPMMMDDDGNAVIDYGPFPHPLEGKPAPELKIDHWFNTEPMTLKALRGKVVVLDFWSITCAPCYNWIPILNRIHEKHSDKGIVVIGLHSPAERTKYAQIQQIIEKEGIKYPIGDDFILIPSDCVAN